MRELVMKSEVDLELLKEYLDGDDAAEEELFARYERDVQIPSDLWAGIEEQITPAHETSFKWWLRVAAVLLLTIGLAISYILFRSPEKNETTAKKVEVPAPVEPEPERAVVEPVRKFKKIKKPIKVDNPGVLSTDLGYLDIDERETAKHIEQTENLLRSIRNFQIADTDDEIDVSYDKALSRRLLIENVVLRREAEMKAKFPTKTLLADLEPFLIDIANLPDQAKPEEVRAIKERVQKTEIVAALLDYQDRGQDRGPNNR
ncbi:MAG TPA: hypothetical protein VGD38_12835 [Pyrinomonadaceae bacterium]